MKEKILKWAENKVIKALKDCAKKAILNAEQVDYLVRKNNLLNEQWFIDFQDKLNEISVR